jgi:hypothetical protein
MARETSFRKKAGFFVFAFHFSFLIIAAGFRGFAAILKASSKH